MKQIRFLLFTSILLFAQNITISGQEISKENRVINESRYWINLGFGGNYFGPTLNAGLSYSCNENIFTVRYLKADEFRWGRIGGGDLDKPSLGLDEIGILYGQANRNGVLVLSFSGGIGYVKGVDRGRKISEKEYEAINISTIGIPLEAKFRFEITNYIGIGGSCFGNLNTKKSFVGGLIEINIGKF